MEDPSKFSYALNVSIFLVSLIYVAVGNGLALMYAATDIDIGANIMDSLPPNSRLVVLS